eukprot:TRINITY_DN6400_c0_g1_i1.p1 TRINITY_DN6400_c0_g1~~TRINITY_DN6400_c0_g1_i1.p1  ORF type:complete len:587 (+),score=60.56 TRINITY_DN6400_c0_g1_i1:68-1762(+)
MEDKLDIRSPEDWYRVTTRQIVQEGGSALIGNYYNWSRLNALKAIYPEHPWKNDSPDVHKASKFWQSPHNLRVLFDDVAKQLNLQSKEEWYPITRAKVLEIRSDAKSALRYYSGSMSDALQAAYPEHEWLPWRFSRTRAGYWDSQDAQKRFFEWAASQLGVSSLDDWYSISGVQIDNLGVKYLVEHYYHHSLPKALAKLYPEHKWDESKFLFRTKEFWKLSKQVTTPPADSTPESGMGNLREVIDRVCQTKGIDPSLLPSDELYNFTSQDIIAAGGSSPLRRNFDSSPAKLLKTLFPQHQWLDWKFATLPRGWWADLSNQRLFLDWVAQNVFKFDPLQSWTAWYDISARQISSAGGSRLITLHGGSPVQLLRTVYPEHHWKAWRFKQVPSGFWDKIDDTSLRQYLDEISQELGLLDLNAWYRVSWAQLQQAGAAHVFLRLGGVRAALKRAYPNEVWDEERLSQFATSGAALKIKAASRRKIYDVLLRIYGDASITEDFTVELDGIPYTFHFYLERSKILIDLVGSSSGAQRNPASFAATANGYKYIQITSKRSYTDDRLKEMLT